MKNFTKLFILVAILTLSLSACYKSPEQKQAEEAKEQLGQLFEDLANTNMDNNTSDEEKMANTMDAMMKMGASMQESNYKNMKSLNKPADFPQELIYSNAKISSITDNSTDDYIDLYLDFETDTSFDKVNEFYKSLFNTNDWKITRQSTDSNSTNISASHNNESIDFRSYKNPYSKIIEFSVHYEKN